MVRSGRYHLLTSAAICVHLVMRRRKPLASAEVRRISAEVRRAWSRGERRRAPMHLSEHLAVATDLKDALPSTHRLFDVLPEGAAIPMPTVDQRGRSVHAIVQCDHVMNELFNTGAALVWGTTPAIGMVSHENDEYTVIRPGSRGTCESVTRDDALAIARTIVAGAQTVQCNVFSVIHT